MIKGMKCTFSLSKPFWWKALISTSNFFKKNISLELEFEVGRSGTIQQRVDGLVRGAYKGVHDGEVCHPRLHAKQPSRALDTRLISGRQFLFWHLQKKNSHAEGAED